MTSYETQLNNDLQWALREGSMHFEGGSAVLETLRRLVESLIALEVDYAIARGKTLFFHGFRRFTEGVDVLVKNASEKMAGRAKIGRRGIATRFHSPLRTYWEICYHAD